jgi:hypothetical protein
LGQNWLKQPVFQLLILRKSQHLLRLFLISNCYYLGYNLNKMKLLPKVKAKGKNHLLFVIGAAMSFGLIYLFVAPKLVKPAAAIQHAASDAGVPGVRGESPASVPGGGFVNSGYNTGMLAHAYRGHGGLRDEAFLAHAYAVRDTSISDVYPYRFRLQGGV